MPRKKMETCRECGQPRSPRTKMALCEEHYRAYMRDAKRKTASKKQAAKPARKARQVVSNHRWLIVNPTTGQAVIAQQVEARRFDGLTDDLHLLGWFTGNAERLGYRVVIQS